MNRFSLLRPIAVSLIGAVLLQALASLLALLPLLALIRFIGAWLSGAQLPGTTVIVAAVAGTLGAAVSAAAATWVSHRADANLIASLQRQLTQTIRRLALSEVNGLGAGRVKKVVDDDTGALHYLVAHTLLDVTALVITPLAGLIALFAVDWRLALFSFVPLLLGVWWYLRAMSGSRAGFAEYAAAQKRINVVTTDLVSGLQTAKIYGGSGSARTRYSAAATGFHDFFRSWSGQTAAVTTASWLIVAPGLTAAAFAILGGALLALGLVSPAVFIAGILLGPAVSAPVAVAGPRMQALRGGLAALDSITAFLARPTLVWGAEEPPGGRVRFEQVSHRYANGRTALHDVTLDLPERGLVALVGASGSGKSTLASLLARFEDPTAGRLLLGDTDLRDLTERSLYERIGFVFQNTGLLNAAVRENLTGGRPTAELDVIRAARQASIHEEILALPRGYDTVLGSEIELSGGQRQRLCLARALVRRPSVLVLDEPLSAVDPTTRVTLMTALRQQAEERCVLLIGHQLHLLQDADHILTLDNGRLVGGGSHEELLASCAPYRELWHAETSTREEMSS